MQSERDGDLVLAKLEDGTDVMSGILDVCRKHRIESGALLWAIGMVREFEVGYFNGEEYERRRYEEPREIIALHGSIAATGDPPLHVHLGAAGPDNVLIGGHLFSGRVSTLAEVCIRSLTGVRLGRALNPRSGLRELTIRKPPRAASETKRRPPRSARKSQRG